MGMRDRRNPSTGYTCSHTLRTPISTGGEDRQGSPSNCVGIPKPIEDRPRLDVQAGNKSCNRGMDWGRYDSGRNRRNLLVDSRGGRRTLRPDKQRALPLFFFSLFKIFRTKVVHSLNTSTTILFV